jgi:thioredoxin-related protein
MKYIIVLVVLILNIEASYVKGKDVFLAKCASCHAEYVSIEDLINNFRNHKNKLLNLKAPAFNRIEYKILRGNKQIGTSEDDYDIRRAAIKEYFVSYLENPNSDDSLASKRSRRHYPQKQSMKGQLSDDEIENLLDFIFEYKKNHTFKIKKDINEINENQVLSTALKTNKKILVFATSEDCHYCKKMKKNVLSLNNIKEELNQNYIFLEVYVNKVYLPFALEKKFPNITPTFFFLNKMGALDKIYPGSWNEKDFLKMLKDHK